MIAAYSDLEELFLASNGNPSDIFLGSLDPNALGDPKLLAGLGGSEAISTHRGSGSGQNSGHESPPRKPKECPNAQKRFRARQKERLSSLEREVAEKKAAFDNLAAQNQVLKARSHILEKVVSCRDEQLGMMQAFVDRCRATPDRHSCFGSVMNFKATESQIEEFKSMKKEQVIPMFKAFLAEVSRYLLHCQYPCSDPQSPIVQELVKCVERFGFMMKHVMILNQPLKRTLLSLNLETMQPATAPESHWDNVVASVQLQPDQRADILAVYDLYCKLVAKVYDERKLITAALGSGCGTLDPGSGSFVERSGMAGEMELVERLNVNMAKEHSAQTLLCCFFFGQVLAPPQFAKVAVYAYPFFPDSLAVASAVARQAAALGRSSGSGSLDSRPSR